MQKEARRLRAAMAARSLLASDRAPPPRQGAPVIVRGWSG